MKASSALTLPLLLGAVPLLSACTTLLDGQYDYRDGWRRGKVVAVIPGAAVERPGYWSCLRQVPAAQRAATNYVLVLYPVTGRASRTRLVPRMPGVDVAPGDSVLVNLDRCDGAVVRRENRDAASLEPKLDERTLLTDVNRPEAPVTNLHRWAGDVNAESPPPFVTSDDHNDLPAHT